MKFTITINSENDASIERQHIVGMLNKVIQKIQISDGDVILDINGNTVGSWELTGHLEEEEPLNHED